MHCPSDALIMVTMLCRLQHKNAKNKKYFINMCAFITFLQRVDYTFNQQMLTPFLFLLFFLKFFYYLFKMTLCHSLYEILVTRFIYMLAGPVTKYDSFPVFIYH